MQKTELQLILGALRCYTRSLAADLDYAHLAAASSSHAYYQRQCIAKLDADGNHFMQLSLRMYNLLEGRRTFDCSVEEILEAMCSVELVR